MCCQQSVSEIEVIPNSVSPVVRSAGAESLLDHNLADPRQAVGAAGHIQRPSGGEVVDAYCHLVDAWRQAGRQLDASLLVHDFARPPAPGWVEAILWR